MKEMKKDKLLEEYNKMKVSNPQEFVGGLNELVEIDTQYSTVTSTRNDSGLVVSTETTVDITKDYYDDEFVTDPYFMGVK